MRDWNRMLTAPMLPVATWLAGMALFTVLCVESLFAEHHAMFVMARLAAYVAALMATALLLGFVALFGLACGVMLWWLEEDALSARSVVAAVARSVWTFCAFVWLAVALLLLDAPEPLSLDDLTTAEEVQAGVDGLLAFRWIESLRYVVLGAFLAVAAWLLARRTKPLNAVLSVGFGVGLVSALVSGLGMLGQDL